MWTCSSRVNTTHNDANGKYKKKTQIQNCSILPAIMNVLKECIVMLVLIHFIAFNTEQISFNNNNFQLVHLHLAFPSFALDIVSYMWSFFFFVFPSFISGHFSSNVSIWSWLGSTVLFPHTQKNHYFLRITNQDEILKAADFFLNGSLETIIFKKVEHSKSWVHASEA